MSAVQPALTTRSLRRLYSVLTSVRRSAGSMPPRSFYAPINITTASPGARNSARGTSGHAELASKGSQELESVSRHCNRRKRRKKKPGRAHTEFMTFSPSSTPVVLDAHNDGTALPVMAKRHASQNARTALRQRTGLDAIVQRKNEKSRPKRKSRIGTVVRPGSLRTSA